MNDALFWLAVTGGEVLLVTFVLLLVYWIRHSAAGRRDRQAVKRLVETVRQGRAEREAVIDQFLTERMGLAGGERDRARVGILRDELALLQRFAKVYRDRVAGDAAQFHLAVEAAVSPYLALSNGGVAAAGVETDQGELEALRKENQRLSEELTVTMETMSRMLSEYSSMFAGSATTAAPPEAGAGGEAKDLTPEPADAGPVQEEAETAAAPEQADALPERPPVALDEQALDISEQMAEASLVQEPLPDESKDSVGTEQEPATEDSPATEEEQALSAADEPAVEELEAIEPEAIDELLAEDPLEEDLGGLFDQDEIAALESEEEKTEESTIAI